MPNNENRITPLRKRDIPLTTSDLYDIAQKRGIEVLDYPLRQVPSLSILQNGECTIGIRPDLPVRDEHVCLAHEMGHCVKGAFYKVYSSGAVRGKNEYKADKWAFHHLVPLISLRAAMESGLEKPHELAEHFEVTEEFMLKAMDYYACIQPMS